MKSFAKELKFMMADGWKPYELLLNSISYTIFSAIVNALSKNVDNRIKGFLRPFQILTAM